MSVMRRITLTPVLALFFALSLWGQPVQDDLPQITGCIALVNARVVTEAGKPPVTSTIVLRNGLITAVGADTKIPPDAYRIAADSLYVYPAFIDAFSHVGIKSSDETDNRGNQGGPGNRGGSKPAVDSEGNLPLEEAGITPFNHVRASLDPAEKSISDWRAQGFAVAHSVPKGKMIPGQGALIVLAGKDADQVLWKEDVSMYAQWTGSGNGYPSTVIAIMAKWRELVQNARQAADQNAAYASASLVPRPLYNQAHEALIPVVNKSIPLYFRAPKVKDISRALELRDDLDLNMVIADAEEAWYLKQKFKSGNIPLILSLDLPEDKAKSKGDDKPKQGPGQDGPGQPGPKPVAPETKPEETKVEIKAEAQDTLSNADSVIVDPEKAAFEKKRAESLKAYYQQAGILASSAIPFSFGTMSVKPGDFSKNINTMIENGLPADVALHALTTHPAKLLGVQKYCGTIATGKMANLIISTKPVFEKDWAIKYMIVEGQLYAYEVKEKKKPNTTTKSSEADHVLLGTWAYTTDFQGEQETGEMSFSDGDGQLNGKITGDNITTGNDELENIVIDGQSVSFTFDIDAGGQMIQVEFDLTLSGETFEGTANVPGIGTVPITGKRISKPE